MRELKGGFRTNVCSAHKKQKCGRYEVFEEYPNVTVVCPKGSRAEAYCKGKDIKVY